MSMDINDLTLDPSGQDKTDSNDSDDQGQLVQGEDSEIYLKVKTEDDGGLVVNSPGTIAFDPSGGQYHFRADTGQGQVTYRVVQVSQGEDGQTQIVANPQIVQGEEGIEMLSSGGLQAAQTDDGIQVLNTGSLSANPQSSTDMDMPQDLSTKSPAVSSQSKVIQSPFSNGGNSPNDPLTGDGRFTYISTGAAGDVAGTAGVAAASQPDQAALGQATLGQVATAGGGQFYVMMSPQDVLQAAGPRVIAPRSGVTPRVDGNRSSRDERRRASHNEVERRRRDKMNEWIVHLSKMVPECAQDNNKMMKSKGGILAKACEYINELRSANTQMSEALKDADKLSVDNDLLRSQVEDLKQENAVLHSQLQQHGVVFSTQDDTEHR